METQTVYVVYEEDRGMGITIEAVYFTEEEAKKHASSSGRLWYDEAPLIKK